MSFLFDKIYFDFDLVEMRHPQSFLDGLNFDVFRAALYRLLYPLKLVPPSDLSCPLFLLTPDDDEYWADAEATFSRIAASVYEAKITN